MLYESPYYKIRNKLINEISNILNLPNESINKFINTAKLTCDYQFKLELHALSKIHKINIKELSDKLLNIKIIELNSLKITKKWDIKFPDLNIESIVKKFELEGTSIKIFLNISILTPYILNDVQIKGKNNFQRPTNESVITVEYSSPNIAKQFHPGHLRTTFLGNFISRIYKKFGYKVLNINYLGDYGKQFGLIIEGLKRFPNEKRFNEEPTKYAYEVYVKISNLSKNDESIGESAKENFKKLENGDKETYEIWKKLRNLSILEYKKQYEILNVEFDIFSGESYFGKPFNSELLKCDKDGSKIFNLGKLGNVVIQRSNGTTLYASRDIHAGLERFNIPNIIKSIYVVASQQDLYFKQLIEIFKQLKVKTECLHINYGMVKDMSTRNGTVIFLKDIIETSTEKMLNVIEKDEIKFSSIKDPKNIALELSLSAILIQDFTAKRIKDYTFNFDRFTSIEGNTGPYLQYTHCRLESIKKKNIELLNKNGLLLYDKGYSEESIDKLLKEVKISGEKIFKENKKIEKQLKIPFEKIDFSILNNKDIEECISLIIRLDYVLEDAFNTHEPCKIVTYAMYLCKFINRLFSSCKVFGMEENISISRLYVFETLRYILSFLIEIIGLRPLERI